MQRKRRGEDPPAILELEEEPPGSRDGQQYAHVELSGPSRALPVFKVLYRNGNRINVHGGHASEVLHQVATGPASAEPALGEEALREAMGTGLLGELSGLRARASQTNR